MKFFSVAIVSALLFATVAYGSPSIKDRVFEKIPFGSKINRTLNHVDAIKERAIQNVPFAKDIHDLAKYLVEHPIRAITLPFEIAIVASCGLFLYTTMVFVPLFVNPLKAFAKELTGPNGGALIGHMAHTFHDHASALVNSLLDADFVKIWEENYRQDLVDGLKRIKACRKDRNESESFARCVVNGVTDLVQTFVENLKEHKNKIFQKMEDYFKDYDEKNPPIKINVK